MPESLAVTGCTDPDSKTKSRRRHHRTKHTEVQLAGDTQTVEPDIDYAGDEAIEIPTTTEDDITLAGDVQICPDYTVEDDLTDDDTNTLGGQGLGATEQTTKPRLCLTAILSRRTSKRPTLPASSGRQRLTT